MTGRLDIYKRGEEEWVQYWRWEVEGEERDQKGS